MSKHRSSWKSKKTFKLGQKPNKPQPKVFNLRDAQIPKGLLDGFLTQALMPDKKKPKKAKVNLLESSAINEDVFNERFSNIGNLNYKETMELVKSSYGKVLIELDGVQLNEKYSLFFRCLSEYSKDVHFDYSLYDIMNNIAYNAIMYSDIPNDMSKSILEITDRININTLCYLRADSGVDMDLCNLISLACNSTRNGLMKVDRVNKMMCLIGDVFDVQTIIDIYESLFDSLFELYGATTTMLVSPEYDKKIIDNADAVILKEVDAVVSILNQAPDWDLDEVLDLCNQNFDAPNKWLLQVLTVATEDNTRVRNAIQMRVRG